MMPYIIILKVRKFHQPTANGFGTARQKPTLPSLNRVKAQVQKDDFFRPGDSTSELNIRIFIKYSRSVPAN